jgi:hypothetical protein
MAVLVAEGQRMLHALPASPVWLWRGNWLGPRGWAVVSKRVVARPLAGLAADGLVGRLS